MTQIVSNPKNSNYSFSSPYLYYLFTSVLLIIFFVLAANSIIEIKILELKFYLNKEQLLNYELSSKVLREKIKFILFNKDDYNSELKTNILESTIMNSEIKSENQHLSLQEEFGLGIVNSVRFISFSEKLNLLEDSKDMYKIQYSFFLERTKKFSQAIKSYNELAVKFQNSKTNENGFVLLHLGFCYAMIGETDEALKNLYITESLFSGTQYSEFARILINVLLENDRKSQQIEKLDIPISEKANMYYEYGRYKDSLSLLDKVEKRSSEENFIRARSLEELGNVSSATNEYISIIEKKDNSGIAKQANRRVFMIGTLYEKNKELSDYSKENAKVLGDNEFIQKVEVASNIMKDNIIVQKINSMDNKEINSNDREILEEIKNDFVKLSIQRNSEVEEIKSLVSKILSTKNQVKFPDIIVLLIDGRMIRTKKIEVVNEFIQLSGDSFIISIPISNIEDIRIDPSANPETFMISVVSSENEDSYELNKLTSKNSDLFGFKENDSIKFNLEKKYTLSVIKKQ